MKALLLANLASLVLATGCLGTGDDITDKYRDADERYARTINGGHETHETIVVPAGTTRLTVKAAWDLDGGAMFELARPDGRTAKEATFGGSNHDEQESWFTMANPPPGEWELEIAVGGSGSYAFGVYL